MRRHLPALLVWCACTLAHAAQPAAEPLIGEATAVLRINDLHWVDRELASYAATAGSDPTALRGTLAQALFHARSLSGIDLSRPAIIAWRSGRAPLLAVVPLSDRRAFIEEFGAISAFGAPLVKIGERDGTMVYTQNTEAGLDEYRLLVQDDTAYLARTVDECRLLATRPPRSVAAGAAAISFRAGGEFLRRPPTLTPAMRRMLPAPPPMAPLLDGMVAWVVRGWDDLVDQVAFVVCDLGPGAEGVVRVQGRIEAKADTLLAGWAAAQKNAASRLLPLVRGPDTVLAVYGQIDWQGQLDRLGQRLTPAARDRFGDAWTPQVEESWRGQWEIADRGGPFAIAIDLVGRGGTVTRELRVQPRAQELVGLERLLAQAGAAAGTSVDALTVGGLSGFRVAGAGHPLRVTVADDHRQVAVEGQGDEVVAQVDALIAGLARPLPPPTGTPAVVAAQLNLTAMVRASEPPPEGGPAVLPQVDLGLGIKATSRGILVIEGELPLQRLAVLVREAAAGRPVK